MTPDQSRQVEVFADVAQAYCALIDSPVQDLTDLSWRQLSRALSQVYAAALNLPDVFDEGAPPVGGSHRPDAEMLRVWVQHLTVDLYWEVFEPFRSEPQEPVCGSLADDLGEIYADLRRGLELFQQAIGRLPPGNGDSTSMGIGDDTWSTPNE